MRIAARCSPSSSSAPSLRLAASMNASPPDTARSGTTRSLVSGEAAVGARHQQRDSAPISSRTPPTSASTSACGSSAAKIPRATAASAVKRSFCIESSAPAQHRFGDVAQDQHAAVRFAFAVQQRLRGGAGIEVRAVEAVGDVFGVRRLAVEQRLAHAPQHRHVGLRTGELARVGADHVVARRAARAQERVVGVNDLRRIVGRFPEHRNRDAFGGRFHRGVERVQALVHFAGVDFEFAAQLATAPSPRRRWRAARRADRRSTCVACCRPRRSCRPRSRRA